MEPLAIVHLSGPRQGARDALRLPARVGSGPGVEIVVPGAAEVHARLVLEGEDVVLQDAGSGRETFLAGEPVREAVLRDGDVVALGPGGPQLRFEREGERRTSVDSGLWPRPEGAERLSVTGAFARAVIRETAARTSRAFRLSLVALLLAGAGVLGWSFHEARRLQGEVARLRDTLRGAEEERRAFEARIAGERRRTEADRVSLEARIEESRAREEALSRQLAAATSDEVRTLRAELETTRTRLLGLEDERAAGERIIRRFGAGVCLIQGSFAYYDVSGRPLRYGVDEGGRVSRGEDGSVSLSVEAKGPIHTEDYFGTGFLVDRRGLVLTNRHVAEPWWKDEEAQALLKEGFQARMMAFRAFFPRTPEPFVLTVQQVSGSVDLALLRIDLAGRRIPVLPLDATGRGAVAGQPVVVVGYPTGLEAILAKADPTDVQAILETHGTQPDRVTDALSRKGLIRPSTTQGHIGDITRTDIVFDAPTTQGGSGGPVFNKNGQVIAVEYAVLQKFGGHSFGLPIRHAFALLREPRKR